MRLGSRVRFANQLEREMEMKKSRTSNLGKKILKALKNLLVTEAGPIGCRGCPRFWSHMERDGLLVVEDEEKLDG